MDYGYDFRTANNDRLEDAGVNIYRQQAFEGFVRPTQDNHKPKNTINKRVKRTLTALAGTIIK